MFTAIIDRLLLARLQEPGVNRLVETIRNRDELKPISPSFCPDALKSAFSGLEAPSVNEVQTRDFALWVDAAVKNVVSLWKKSPIHEMPAQDQIRLVSEIVTGVMLQDAEYAVKKAAEINRANGRHRLYVNPQDVSITLGSGIRITTQELGESIIEAMTNLLRHAIVEAAKEKATNLASVPEVGQYDVRGLAVDLINVALAYRAVVDFWQRVESGCWSVHKKRSKWYLRPREKVVTIEASRHRKSVQDTSGHAIIARELAGGERPFPELPRFEACEFKYVSGVWKFAIRLPSSEVRLIEEATFVCDAFHSWLSELSSKEFNVGQGVNGAVIFGLFLALRRLSHDFHLHCLTLRTFPGALIIEKKDLFQFFAKTLGWTFRQVALAVPFVIHDGSLKTELYGNPLIALPGEKFLIFSPAAAAADGERVLDRAIKKNIPKNVYGEKGHYYEAGIREILSYHSAANHFAKGWWSVCPVKVDVPIGAKNNEIDLLLRIGDTILVGEVKCTSHPADYSEIRERLDTIEGAAEQACNKINYLEKNWARIARKIPGFLPQEQGALDVLPFVLVNGSYGAGFNVSGVPVTDIGMIGSYLWRGPKMPIVMDGSRIIELPLYEDRVSFERNFVRFLKKPPLIDFYKMQQTDRILRYKCGLLDCEVVLHEKDTRGGQNGVRTARAVERRWRLQVG